MLLIPSHDELPAAAEENRPGGKDFRDARVLVVDDRPANVALLEEILQDAGYQDVLTTTDPDRVHELVRELEPDLILLDLQMPRRDGFAVLAQLKEMLASDVFLPVLVLTVDSNPQIKVRALAEGAHDFVTKPFDVPELVQRVAVLLRMRQLHLQVQEQKANLEALVHDRTKDLQHALHKLKRTQDQLVQQERLHAFGTMASGVTHDFNNALSVILGFGEIALLDYERGKPPASMAQCVRTMLTAARDGAAMVTRLREFYRPGAEDEPRTAVDLNALLQQAITITEPKWKTQSLGRGLAITIETQLADVAAVAAEPAELREAVTNLIFNAVDAMPEGGSICIRSHARQDEVVVEIEDSGAGMTEEVRTRCLEPFFTTKGEQGTGMGLAMVYGIIERHGGRMEIESSPGMGCTICFTLPKYVGPTRAAFGNAPEPLQRLKILVVDDQPVLCEILSEYLKNDLHDVEVVFDGVEALEMFKSRRFDLVITDLAMPKMNGEQLAAAIKQISPSTPIILLTGFGDTPHGEQYGGVAEQILSKPVSTIDLRHAILRAMQGREAAAKIE